MNHSVEKDPDFTALMDDVRPLSKANQADTGKKESVLSDAQRARREAAEAATEDRNFLSDDFVELLTAHDPVEFRREGIQIGVVDKLRHGGYPVQAQLHLLRRSPGESRRVLYPFIQDAFASDLRSLLVVHGRGRHDDSPPNILRSYIAKWLAQFDEVQAYTSAQPSDGGLGATWVMLRKSDRAKANNRERQQKRRG